MKNIVITGSARGIGFEMAKEFLRCGMNVTISSLNRDSLDHAMEKLQEYKDRVFGVLCDVRVKDEVRNLWHMAEGKWGSVDIWINNAGISQPRGCKLWELPDITTDGIVYTKIFNILGDKPDVVAKYLVKNMLINQKNNAHISWLTTGKVMGRFMLAPFRKRDIFNT